MIFRGGGGGGGGYGPLSPLWIRTCYSYNVSRVSESFFVLCREDSLLDLPLHWLQTQIQILLSRGEGDIQKCRYLCSSMRGSKGGGGVGSPDPPGKAQIIWVTTENSI